MVYFSRDPGLKRQGNKCLLLEILSLEVFPVVFIILYNSRLGEVNQINPNITSSLTAWGVYVAYKQRRDKY